MLLGPMLIQLSINSKACLSVTLKVLQVLHSLRKWYFSNILTHDFPAKGFKFSKMEAFQLDAQAQYLLFNWEIIWELRLNHADTH